MTPTQKQPNKVVVADEFVVLRDVETGKLIVARREWLTK